MIERTLTELERKIEQGLANERQKAELRELLGQLRNEVESLAETHAEQARAIAVVTGRSADEATRSGRSPQSVQSALDELSASVTEFEKSHPQLVQVVNRIATTLSNLGI